MCTLIIIKTIKKLSIGSFIKLPEKKLFYFAPEIILKIRLYSLDTFTNI